MRSHLHIAAAVILTAACTTTGNGCEEPPASELSRLSDLALTLSPNPVAAGSEATLSLERGGLDETAITGAGAAWQCWDGENWIGTH